MSNRQFGLAFMGPYIQTHMLSGVYLGVGSVDSRLYSVASCLFVDEQRRILKVLRSKLNSTS
jgi:hypothetical protein